MNKRNNLLALFVGLAFVSIFIWVLDYQGWLNWLRRPLEKIINPTKKIIYQPQFEENKKAEIGRQIESLEYQLSELKKENQEMRKLLESPLPPDWKFVLGDLTGLEDGYITLSVGLDQGLKEGQAVVVQNHLVGRLVSTQPQSSRVMLVTHPDFEAEAMIADSVVFGRAIGQGGGVNLENIETKYNLGEDQLVVTSGKDNLPKDLIVGRVGQVQRVESAVYQKAFLKLSWQPEELRSVFVVSLEKSIP